MKLLGNDVGAGHPLFFIAGPCVIESRDMALGTANTLAGIAARQNVQIIYKSSFDKANRTSMGSFRGIGMDEGLRILEDVKTETGLPVLTDIHLESQISETAKVADVLQTPALLCRQTDFITAVARAGLPVNIKKGQFMAPMDMASVLTKTAGNDQIMLCERGISFGYNNLVVDMRGIDIMRGFGQPVVFDATHSCQLPSGGDGVSDGERRFVPVLARAAVAAGADGVFMESHPDPDNALCDGPNSWPIDKIEALIVSLVKIRNVLLSK